MTRMFVVEEMRSGTKMNNSMEEGASSVREWMKRKSILYKDLEVSRAKEIYDESCKNIRANKIILAWIMKSCMKE